MMKLSHQLLRLMLAFALCCALPGMAQETDAMERFDIEAFKRDLIKHNGVLFLPDGTMIHQFGTSRDGYIEDRTPPQSAYTYRKVFDTQGRLIATTQEFYSFFTGITKHYDGHGNLIKEEVNDRDQYFSFSIEDLAAKMLADYKIDIMNADNVYKLNRGQNFDPPFYFYQVYFYDLTSPAPDQALIALLVDGTTGEVLHTLQAHIMEPTSVFNAYLEKMATTK